jgi:hypothetical protein
LKTKNPPEKGGFFCFIIRLSEELKAEEVLKLAKENEQHSNGNDILEADVEEFVAPDI